MPMFPEFSPAAKRRFAVGIIGLCIVAIIGGVFHVLPPVWAWGGLVALGAVAGGRQIWRRSHRSCSLKPDKPWFGEMCEAVLRGAAGKNGSQSMTPKVLMRQVDALLERYPSRPEIKLAKAQLLIQLYRDAHGARSYCREVIGATRRDDPLFQDALHLHLSTYRPAGRASCASHAFDVCPAHYAVPRPRRPHRQAGAKVIPFPLRNLPRL